MSKNPESAMFYFENKITADWTSHVPDSCSPAEAITGDEITYTFGWFVDTSDACILLTDQLNSI